MRICIIIPQQIIIRVLELDYLVPGLFPQISLMLIVGSLFRSCSPCNLQTCSPFISLPSNMYLHNIRAFY